jgi:hypothetical protein
MNKIFLMAVICQMCAALSSCSSDESLDSSVNPSNEQVMAPVKVVASDYDISQGEFAGTRAKSVGEYAGIKALTLAFYRAGDDHEMVKMTHFKSDPSAYTTFGEFSTSLPLGSYTMVVLGYGQGNSNQEITLTSPTSASYGEGAVRETFAYTQSVNITNSAAVELSATLVRVISALAVRSTDNRPAEVTHLRITYSAGGKSFSPSSGLATSNTGFVDLIAFGSAAGESTYSGSFLFLDTDEQTMDVTIETLDGADGNVLFSRTFADVPFKRNRQTTFRGKVYTNSAEAGSFQVEEGWITANTIDF